MRHRTFQLIIFFLSVAIVVGCSNKKQAEAKKIEAGEAQKIAAAAPLDPSKKTADPKDAGPNDTIVTVGGKIITRAEVDQARDNRLMQMQGRVPPDQLAALQASAWNDSLKDLVSKTMLEQAADKKGIQPDTQEIGKQAGLISDNFPSPEDFQKMLDTMGLSQDEFRQEIALSMKITSLLETKYASLQEISQEDAKTYYDQNPNQFQTPGKISASHILLSTEANASEEELEKTQKKLEGIREEISNGADFAQKAKEYSDCPSSAKGGDLGTFGRGQMVKPFEDAAYNLDVGGVSQIVKTQFGFHLIKLTDRQEAGVTPFKSVSANILSFLSNQQKEKVLVDYLEQLKSETAIEYSEGFQP